MGLTGSAIKEEKDAPRKGGGGVKGGTRGSEGKKGHHVIDVRSMLNTAVTDASSAAIENVSLFVCVCVHA